MPHKKRFATLLETLIALSLAMLILTTLTYFYRQITTLNRKGEEMQEMGFKMRYLENRLSAILPNAVSETDEKKDFFFFSTASQPPFTMPGSPTLIFTYDNGTKLDKLFSNNVLGRLYLDSEGRFCLTSWPSPKRWTDGINPPIKKEILLEGVRELQISFFVAPEKEWQLEKSPPKKEEGQESLPALVKPTPAGSWLPSWSFDYHQLPALVKLQVTLNNGTVRLFVFPLPKSQRQIVYTQ